MYSDLVKTFGWSLREIDDTNMETLIEFIGHGSKQKETNLREINGKTYKRAKGVPAWL